jgi:pimeloyl-ACP methyl ester carboxylesterase
MRTAALTIDRRSVELGGRRVSYLSSGEAATARAILLIHGSGVSAGYWVNQLRSLGEVFRVAAIDLPGHGKSDPIPQASVEAYSETVARLLEALDTGPVLVVGHSLGGAVAIALAARRPHLVTGLVLISSCAKLPWVDASRERWLACLPGPLRKILFFWMAQKLLFSASAPNHAVSLGMQELRACRAETIVQDFHAAQAMDLTRQATELDVPTLILCGSRDRLTPPTLSEHLGRLIPRSRLSLVEGAGHMLLLEAPERLNQEILTFAASLRGEAPSSTVVWERRGRSVVRRLLDWSRACVPFLTS